MAAVAVGVSQFPQPFSGKLTASFDPISIVVQLTKNGGNINSAYIAFVGEKKMLYFTTNIEHKTAKTEHCSAPAQHLKVQ